MIQITCRRRGLKITSAPSRTATSGLQIMMASVPPLLTPWMSSRPASVFPGAEDGADEPGDLWGHYSSLRMTRDISKAKPL
jgi:hypothetical protein